MKEKRSLEPKPPQNLDGFIALYAPRFAAHPNELAMVVERRSESALHGGPGMEDPAGGIHCGLITGTDYCVAVIDPSGSFRKKGSKVFPPVGPSFFVGGHGTNVLDEGHLQMHFDIFEIAKMGETLLSQDMKHAMQPLPVFEIFVGDDEVAGALAFVQHEREVVAIGEVAKQLGHPIVRSKVLEDTREEQIAVQVDILIRLFRGLEVDGPSWSIVECMRALKHCGVTGDEVIARIAERATTQIKLFLGKQGA